MTGALGTAALAVFVITGIAGCTGGDSDDPNGRPESDDTSWIPDARKARIRDFWSVYRHARASKLEGSWQEAIESYRRALEFDPRHEDSLYGLANCYVEVGRYEDALGALDRLIGVNPLSQRGHLQKGMIHALPGGAAFDLDAAEAALERAREINEEETGALLRLGEVTLMKGDDDRALECLTLANRSNFRAVEAYYLRAFILWKRSRIDEARELLREARRHAGMPIVVAGVPGEGDTRPGASLPPTTLDEKLPLRRFWSGLIERHPDVAIETSALGAEFDPLKTYLNDLRARAEGAPR